MANPTKWSVRPSGARIAVNGQAGCAKNMLVGPGATIAVALIEPALDSVVTKLTVA